jgi:predicted nucleic acid-binding Zn ribbon protein
VHRVQRLVASTVAGLLRDVPLSSGKVEFAWRTSVGDAVHRATRVHLGEHGVLAIEVPDQHWRREVERSSPLVLARLETLLGPGVVTRLKVRVLGPSDEGQRHKE